MINIDDFLKIEEELGLFNKTYKSFYYWIYFRQTLYTWIDEEKNEHGRTQSRTTINLKKILGYIKNFLFDKRYRFPKEKGNILFLCHARRNYWNGQYESIYTDVYANAYADSITIEAPYAGGHYTPPCTRNIFYMDSFFCLRAMLTKLCCFLDKKSKSIERELQLLSDRLLKDFDYRLDIEQAEKTIIFYYYRHFFTRAYFRRILARISPKAIVEVVYYNFEVMTMNEVAGEMKIPTIELQHGTTGRYHIAYNFIHSNGSMCLPRYHCAFSDVWADSIRMPHDTEVVATGFDYFERQRERYPVKEFRNAIIFISQGTIGNSLVRIALELKRMMFGFKIIYKLHPGEYRDWKDRYPELINSSIEVIDTADIPIYELFSGAIAQVGVYSTALFEGIGYNLKTFLLNCSDTYMIKGLFREGEVVFVDSAAEICNNVKQMSDTAVDCERYWKPNAYENFCTLLEKVVYD